MKFTVCDCCGEQLVEAHGIPAYNAAVDAVIMPGSHWHTPGLQLVVELNEERDGSRMPDLCKACVEEVDVAIQLVGTGRLPQVDEINRGAR